MTKSKRQEKLLVQDAQGHLYAIPVEKIHEYALPEEEAKELIAADSRKKQSVDLTKAGFVTQLKGAELPNFRILMQTEYD